MVDNQSPLLQYLHQGVHLPRPRLHSILDLSEQQNRSSYLKSGPRPSGSARISHRWGAGLLPLAGDTMVRVAE